MEAKNAPNQPGKDPVANAANKEAKSVASTLPEFISKERKKTAQAKAANSAPDTATSKTGKIAKPAKGKAKKVKLGKFDFGLLQLVKEGRTSAVELLSIFNVDEAEFNFRLETLEKRKLIVVDATAKTVKLSIEATNQYSPKWKKAADAWMSRTASQQNKTEQTQPLIVHAAPPSPTASMSEPHPTTETKPAHHLEQKKLVVEIPFDAPELTEKPEHLDLMDVIKKYGPTEQQKQWNQSKSPFLERNKVAQAPGQSSPKPASPTNRPQPIFENLPPLHQPEAKPATLENMPAGNDKESCELCKDKFTSSVNPSQHNPKYGHCFCGAAYHKDCYEAILEGEKRCLNCGRKLVLAIDLKSEEAIGELKDAFD